MSTGPALLSVSEVRLAYGHQTLLDGIILSVGAGEKVGLVGRNGCGKTSLLRIIAGESKPDSGDVSLRRGLRIGYLPQEFELDGNRTVRENIEEGAADLRDWLRRYEAGEGSEAELAELQDQIQHADGWHLETRIETIASALGTATLDAPVGPLSGGEKRRVALCRALVAQPDLLLLDEPTNHLDSESIRWLEDFLREFPGAVIFVTHDRYFLDVIATRVIEISEGRCYSHAGNYTAYLESKAIRQQIAEQSERRRQRFIRVELEWVRAGVRAQRSKSKHRLDKFYDVAGLEAPVEEREMDLILPPPPELGNTVIEIKDAGARVGSGSEERWLFRGLNLSIRPGQCTGVIGRNGVGKTTLLRLCLETRVPEEGTVTVGKRVVYNYIDQARMQLNPANTVLLEVAGKNEIVHFGDETLSARAYLRRFLFPDDRIGERVEKLSGGERARLMLAKVLCRGGNVLVLDEPTNDLDLPSLRMLEEAIADFSGSVLVVSHDRYFLDRICDQVVAFEDAGVFVHTGNYSYYLEKRREREALARQWASVGASGGSKAGGGGPAAGGGGTGGGGAKGQKPRKLSFKEQKELEGIETVIHGAEQEVAALEAKLHDPTFYASHARDIPTLMAELDGGKARVATLYARWEELEAVRSASEGGDGQNR